MFTVFVILILLIGLLMSAIILAQSPKGDGLSGALGAPGGVGTMFGVRRAADFLVKATIALAAIFIVFCIAVNRLFLPTGVDGSTANPLREGQLPSAPVQSMPAQQAPASAPAPQQAPAK
jgi:preprotein translocase subunit SecG